MTIATTAETYFTDLLDYRRQVSDLYYWQRQSKLEPTATCDEFRRRKDDLLRHHPQSALTEVQRAKFPGLAYYPYDPAWRFVVPVKREAEPEIIEVMLSADGLTRMVRFGKAHISFGDTSLALSLYWLNGYGGGLFLPFGDATNNDTTYGGGRYLLDTIKHADLGQDGDQLILDFNYAYNPSCAYNHQWHCPLAPAENRLSIPVPVGEKQLKIDQM